MIDPALIAFDIDGVFADTMRLFLQIAGDEYHINGIKYEDFTSYILEECIDLDAKVTTAIISKIMDGNYTAPLEPILGAPEVLTKLGKAHSPVLFVTARPYLGPIQDWILNTLPLDKNSIEIIPTGDFGAKAEVLLNKNIRYFVEDRLETCFQLNNAGIIPILFKQPWNRQPHPFKEVGSWNELESLIKF
ncbi:MAG: haloacid dehalogenase [Desulfobacterales bacterium]|nr:haloacid dehalogenase [Desulfobacterales bacterium]